MTHRQLKLPIDRRTVYRDCDLCQEVVPVIYRAWAIHCSKCNKALFAHGSYEYEFISFMLNESEGLKP